MSQLEVANRYAVALFELAKEQNALDQVEQELSTVASVIASNKDFSAIMSHPKISGQNKKQLFNEAFSYMSKSVLHTLLLLVDRQRENIIPELTAAFTKLANEARGVADATVYSVRELSDEEEKALSTLFAKRINKEKLRIHNVVDKSLIGGVKIRIGNTIYDGSVKRKLEQIERQIVSAKS